MIKDEQDNKIKMFPCICGNEQIFIGRWFQGCISLCEKCGFKVVYSNESISINKCEEKVRILWNDMIIKKKGEEE